MKIITWKKDINVSSGTQHRSGFMLYKTQVHLVSEQYCMYVLEKTGEKNTTYLLMYST